MLVSYVIYFLSVSALLFLVFLFVWSRLSQALALKGTCAWGGGGGGRAWLAPLVPVATGQNPLCGEETGGARLHRVCAALRLGGGATTAAGPWPRQHQPVGWPRLRGGDRHSPPPCHARRRQWGAARPPVGPIAGRRRRWPRGRGGKGWPGSAQCRRPRRERGGTHGAAWSRRRGRGSPRRGGGCVSAPPHEDGGILVGGLIAAAPLRPFFAAPACPPTRGRDNGGPPGARTLTCRRNNGACTLRCQQRAAHRRRVTGASIYLSINTVGGHVWRGPDRMHRRVGPVR